MPRPTPPLSAELREAVRTQPFVFFGTVQRPGGSNIEALDREAIPTAVVRVDEVLAAPHALGDVTGRDITVRLAGSAPRRAQRVLFVASSLMYGEELAVNEVARVTPGRAFARLRTGILDEKLRQMDDDLRARLRRAALVVYGRVESVAVHEPESAATQPPVGEAAPAWRIAELLVWRVLKGRGPAQPRVVFPYPRTQKWSEIPLYFPEQEGIWLLHQPGRGRAESIAWRPPTVTDGFEAPDELDFHAPSALNRMQLLLQLPASGERS